MNIVNVGSKLPYLFLFPAPPPRGGLRGPKNCNCVLTFITHRAIIKVLGLCADAHSFFVCLQTKCLPT